MGHCIFNLSFVHSTDNIFNSRGVCDCGAEWLIQSNTFESANPLVNCICISHITLYTLILAFVRIHFLYNVQHSGALSKCTGSHYYAVLQQGPLHCFVFVTVKSIIGIGGQQEQRTMGSPGEPKVSPSNEAWKNWENSIPESTHCGCVELIVSIMCLFCGIGNASFGQGDSD